MAEIYTLGDLSYDDDQYFAGFGAQALGTSRPLESLEVERYRSADGETTYTLYHPEAMQRAAQRSVRAGGGYMGLCSDHLRKGEYVTTSDETLTIAECDARVKRASRLEPQHTCQEPFDTTCKICFPEP